MADNIDARRFKTLRLLYRSTLPKNWRKSIRFGLTNVKSPLRRLKLTKPLIIDQAASHTSIAKAHLMAWNLEQALESADAALAIEPNNRRALQLKSTILGHLGRFDESLIAANSCLRSYPVDVASRKNLRALGVEPPEASRLTALTFVRAKMFNPSVCLDAATYLYYEELFADAVEFCEIGLVSAAKHSSSPNASRTVSELKLQMAMALEAAGDYRQASAIFRELASDARLGLKAAGGLARCLLDVGQPHRAELLLEATSIGTAGAPFTPLKLDVLQAQGKLRESYNLYRQRPLSQAMAHAFGKRPPEELNILGPHSNDQTAFVVMEGGPGDELRFTSVFGDLQQAFRQVTISCDPRLEPLLKRSFPKISFLPVPRMRREFARAMSDRMSLPNALLFQCVSDKAMEVAAAADQAFSILDALADVRPDRTSFQKCVPGIQPAPELVSRISSGFPQNGKRRVGLAWRSMLKSVARNRHYLSIEDLLPLRALDCEFWLFQPSATEEEIAQLREFLTLMIPEDIDLIDDLDGQVALASLMDAVVSPFTTTGELASATGTPTIMLSTSSNTAWRRAQDGSDIWHKNTRIVIGEGFNPKLSACTKAADELRGILGC